MPTRRRATWTRMRRSAARCSSWACPRRRRGTRRGSRRWRTSRSTWSGQWRRPARRSGGWGERAGGVRALAEVAAAVAPSLAGHVVAELPAGRWEAGLDGDRAFTMEAVYEGFLLHYREPRVFDRAMDADLGLLAGDALYALGLDSVAQTGDLAAVAELADLISLCAQAEAEGRPEAIEPLWEAALEALSPAGGPGACAAAAS